MECGVKVVTRRPRKGEIQALRGMWRKVFGEVGEASFFEHLFSFERTVVAEREEKIAAMGYIVPAGELVYGEESLPCAMLYAIATLPEHRGEGIGAAVVGELVSESFAQGYSAVVLCPSTDSLFEYYSARTKLRDWFYADEKGISATSTFAGAPQKSRVPKIGMDELSPAQYFDKREAFLEGTIHIRHNPAYLEYQKLLCKELGGGLFGIGNSCAVVEIQQSGAVWVKELLVSGGDDERDAISAITSAFPSFEYIYRCPAKSGQGRRFGMLTAKPGALCPKESPAVAPWYGLAFD